MVGQKESHYETYQGRKGERDSGFQMTEESSRMSFLATAGQKGSASSSDFMDSAGIGGPVDTKGQHQMVLSLGISVLSTQGGPGDPGGPQGVHGKGSLSFHNQPGTHSLHQAWSKVRKCGIR